MVFFKSLPEDAGPKVLFEKYPDIYSTWSAMSEALMNGPSPLTQGEREMLLAYAAGAADCKFVYVAHSQVAYAWGIEEGLLDKLLENLDDAPIDDRMKALLRYVGKLMVSPSRLEQADADAVFAAGWDEKALHDAIAVTARAAFMQRLVQGHGFTPLSKDEAIRRAKRRVEMGYVKLYPEFAKGN